MVDLHLEKKRCNEFSKVLSRISSAHSIPTKTRSGATEAGKKGRHCLDATYGTRILWTQSSGCAPKAIKHSPVVVREAIVFQKRAKLTHVEEKCAYSKVRKSSESAYL